MGVGGINKRHTDDTKAAGDIGTCYCDVDTRNYANALAHKDDPNWKDARGYQDYRKMLAKHIDAVIVGMPDHRHFPATALAMVAARSQKILDIGSRFFMGEEQETGPKDKSPGF